MKRGKVTAEKKAEVLGRITATTDYAALAGVDLVVEAVFEDPKIKAEVTATRDTLTLSDLVDGAPAAVRVYRLGDWPAVTEITAAPRSTASPAARASSGGWPELETNTATSSGPSSSEAMASIEASVCATDGMRKRNSLCCASSATTAELPIA